jgi:uncharacterized protein (DUF488 family)
MKPIKTIGHSNHPIERFVDLLKAAGVETLVDVRSTPYSRRFPQFGREKLAGTLAGSGIDYLYAGAALGGKSGASYDASAAQPAFRDALGDLIARANGHTLCLMCAEKEPLDCHRTVLVSRRLAERGVTVEHLLADGHTEPHASIEDKLLGKGGPDLFSTDRATRLAEAYAARERKMKGASARSRL